MPLCVGLLLFSVGAEGLAQSIAKGDEGSDGETDKGAFAFLEIENTLTSGNEQTSALSYHYVWKSKRTSDSIGRF